MRLVSQPARLTVRAAAWASLSLVGPASAGPATFLFDGSLAAEEAGLPDLVSVDPLGANGFTTANVFGQNRTVWGWDGNRSPITEQAGLLLDTSSFLADNGTYSLELVFRFTEDNNTWRSIFNTRGRTSDNAFYVSPGDRLQIYPLVTGPDEFTTNDWHHVVLTRTESQVQAFLDGVLQFTTVPTPQNLEITEPIVSFFLDNNLGGPAQSEFADGQIAKLAFSDAVLTPGEVEDRANNPFPQGPGGPIDPPPVDPTDPPAVIPLPAAVWAAIPTLGLVIGSRLRRRRH